MSLKQIIMAVIVIGAVLYGYKEYTGKSLSDEISNKTKSMVSDTKKATLCVAEKRKAGLEESAHIMQE